MSTALAGVSLKDEVLVMGEGPVPCTAMIVGEAPGATEARLGRPFVGPSGNLLEEALNMAGANRAEVFITNAYKYRPDNNRNPTEDELDEHRLYLEDELSAVSPLGVLLLGAIATRAMLPDEYSGITKMRGKVYSGDEVDYYPTFHPAYVLRNPKAEPEFFGDVAEFVERTLRLAR